MEAQTVFSWESDGENKLQGLVNQLVAQISSFRTIYGLTDDEVSTLVKKLAAQINMTNKNDGV